MRSYLTGPCLLLLAWTVGLTTPLHAVSASSPLTTPAAAFVAFRPGFDLIVSNTQGSLGAANPSLAVAPLHLPDGVVVTALAGHFLDQDAAASARLSLMRRRISTNPLLSNEEMALVVSAGSSASVQTRRDSTVLDPVVDNTRYIYYLYATLGPQLSLYGAQVEFTGPPLLVDGFESGGTDRWSAHSP